MFRVTPVARRVSWCLKATPFLLLLVLLPAAGFLAMLTTSLCLPLYAFYVCFIEEGNVINMLMNALAIGFLQELHTTLVTTAQQRRAHALMGHAALRTRRFLKRQMWERLWKKADADRDGFISRAEWIGVLRQGWMMPVQEAWALRHFRGRRRPLAGQHQRGKGRRQRQSLAQPGGHLVEHENVFLTQFCVKLRLVHRVEFPFSDDEPHHL